MTLKPALGALALAGLSGCIDVAGFGATPQAGPPSVDEQTCLAAVARAASNPDVIVMSAQPAETGTLMRIGVGPDRAPWTCIAYEDGTVGEVMSLAEEGAL